MREQIEVSLTLLEGWSGYRPFTLSYPYGSRDACSVKVSEIAAQLGIDFALTTESAANQSLAHPLHLAYFVCCAAGYIYAFAAVKLEAAWSRLRSRPLDDQAMMTKKDTGPDLSARLMSRPRSSNPV